MQLSIQNDLATGFAVVLGEIDIATAPDLEAALSELSAAPCVTLDFSGVSFMDSSGIAVLSRSVRRRADRATIRLIGVSPFIRRSMEICGLDRLPGLEIAPDGSAVRTCPCCDGVLVGFGVGATPHVLHLMRAGDRYCPECDLLVRREVLDGEERLVDCPSHSR